MRPSRSTQCEPSQTATVRRWRGEERKGKSSSKAKKTVKLAKNLQRAPYWRAAVRRKQGLGQRNHQDQTSVYRVGRRLDGEECKALQQGEEKLAECTVLGGLCEESKERSTRPSRTIKCVLCPAAAGWRGVQSPSRRQRKESPPARQRRPSQPKNLQSVPYRAASSRRVKKERSTRPSRPIKCVPCHAAAGWRRVQSPSRRQRKESPQARRRRTSWPKLAECTVLGGLCKESKERKVTGTIKIHQVCTVSGGGWMERYSPSRWRRKKKKSPLARRRRPSRPRLTE
jgi:hypothetical protein